MATESSEPRTPADRPNIVQFPAVRKSGAKGSAPSPAKPDDEEPLSAGAMIRIGIFLVVLVFAGVWLMNTLRDMGKMQDCAMQGRRNCAQIEVPSRDR